MVPPRRVGWFAGIAAWKRGGQKRSRETFTSSASARCAGGRVVRTISSGSSGQVGCHLEQVQSSSRASSATREAEAQPGERDGPEDGAARVGS
jgi:hypothetical protein